MEVGRGWDLKGNDPSGDTPIFHWTMIMGGRVYQLERIDGYVATPMNVLVYHGLLFATFLGVVPSHRSFYQSVEQHTFEETW